MMKANPGWDVTIKGTEHYEHGKPTIFVANHQSFMDMPLTYLLPWTMKWVSKKSLFKIPVFGWIIYMTGHLGIDRKSLRSVKLLDKLVEPIQDGIPAMLFPEGTRTITGEIGNFKDGAFTLARQYNFQLQPLVLEGGHQAMPAGTWKFNLRQQFYVSVLEPVNPGDFDTVAEFREHVQEQLKNELELLRGRSKQPSST
ncbi:1-acyl-sn-glycerol-3-phosphate acyltransferase [Aliifodinibius sp. S!AR15-10]|uniref:lysophospholipid acyltransferase family protein n=1 Tax=Aliifodinibius sp. S!AR15-10 TaxID=2950437 RepID=UPI002860ABB8|nr:lysophospholipid acyltransferase family protein [Aliifodinibius sp. S!AR15-10]MDR8391837.1 1-acyl-sn-glycerol-3-phosphate acyltransferase [Aliifodinibius sp. S!AR15-10]